MKKKVLIIQPILAHYRKSVFIKLAESKEFEIKIIAGKQNGNIKGIEENNPKVLANLVNKTLSLKGHNFIWQKGAVSFVRKEKPDVLVLTGVDPHLISNLYLAVFCKIFLSTKIIWWGHASTKQQGRAGEMFRKFFFNLASGIFTYSENGKNNLQPLVKSSIQIAVLNNAINEEEYGFNHASKETEHDRLTILFSGRITNEKRLDILVMAMKVLRDKGVIAKCIVIGNGPAKQHAEHLVKEHGLQEIVTFLGERYEEESIPYFEKADLFVLPGKVGLSIIHGLSYGLPVITTNRVEVHSPEFEIIQPGINGDFFNDFDAASLADKIIQWTRKIKENRSSVAHNCIESIIQKGYTPEKMSNKMLAMFKHF